MRTQLALAAAVLALSPAVASATTQTTIINQTSIFYDHTGSDLDIGDFDLDTQPVAVTALFGDASTNPPTAVTDVNGSLTFGVFSSSGAPGASGSMNINIIADAADNESIDIATFDGVPLVFALVDGDFVATVNTAFSGASDIATLFFDFSGFDSGDQFQVNVSAVSAIPLPASLPLLMGALGGLGFLSRRRRKAALVA